MADNRLIRNAPAADDWQDVDDWEDAPSELPALPQEQGLKKGGLDPRSLVKTAANMLGFDTDAAGGAALNTMAQGYLPQVSGAVGALSGEGYLPARDRAINKQHSDAASSPGSVALGTLTGAAATGGAISSGVKQAPTALARIGQAAGMGAAQGAAYNPGDVEGEINPLQLGDRAGNSALGAFLSGGMGVIGEAARGGARIAGDIRSIKEGTMSDQAKTQIDDALAAVKEKQIAPRDAELRKLIHGQKFEINPDRVKPTFSGLGGKMADKLQQRAGGGDFSAVGGPRAQVPSRLSISSDRALRLKRAADSVADYGKSKKFEPTAVAKGEEAKSLADILRRQINAVSPRTAQLNDEMANIYSKMNALKWSSGDAPIAAIRAQPGTDKDSLVKAIDKLAGSSLDKLDNRIGTAQSMLLTPGKLAHPLSLPGELIKMGTRGAVEAAAQANKAPEGTKEALIQALLESKRR